MGAPTGEIINNYIIVLDRKEIKNNGDPLLYILSDSIIKNTSTCINYSFSFRLQGSAARPDGSSRRFQFWLVSLCAMSPDRQNHIIGDKIAT
jgi:hypothetical protein